MTEIEYLLVIFQEELGEVSIELLRLQHSVSKALRFGLNESQQALGYTNRKRIHEEWNDLLGSIKMLEEYELDLTPSLVAVEAKVAKINKYMNYSKECGVVE